MERLQKVIAQSGFCSRRKAEELIVEGKVQVNGVACTVLGTKINPEDEVIVDGVKLELETKVYYLFYKPKNCLTTSKDDRNRPTVMNYLKDIDQRVFAVGRLDFDTTGALLITNDGELANHLIHPRYEVEKQYQAKCLGKLDEEDLEKLTAGIELEDGFVKALKTKVLKYDKINNTTDVEIWVSEGRNHMIKRMVAYLGSEVIALKRCSFAGLTLGNLRPGTYRKLTDKEVSELKKVSK